jgi:hypothetical protein
MTRIASLGASPHRPDLTEQVHEQARDHGGEGRAEALMGLVVPAGQDMATKADIDAAVSSMKGFTLRTLLLALTPLHLGMLGPSLGVAGLYFTG